MWVSRPLSDYPINSPDPAIRAKGVAALEKCIELAHHAGCGALLIYSARLGNGAKLVVGSQDTWDRVSESFPQSDPGGRARQGHPHSGKCLEQISAQPSRDARLRRPVSQPWLQTHFDIGNVMQYGYPQDWILTLGSRIKRVHVKDYKLSNRAEQGHFAPLLEGDVDWKAVMAALVK